MIDNLESNLCFLRCYFSIAVIHLKYTGGCKRLTEADIMQHCYAATLKHFKTMKKDHCLVLETALSTIFIQCSDNFLSDISWHYYIEPGALVVKILRLQLEHSLMSLTACENILGSKIVAHFLVFAHVYREMREIRVALGIFQLIRYKDRIICVIFAIVCLENFRTSGAMDYVQLSARIIALSGILNKFELEFKSNYSYSLDGAFI